jgi:hypothetical protein
VRVKVDASNLPGKYTAVVIGCCLNFPRRLIFFLTATFKVGGARARGGGPGPRAVARAARAALERAGRPHAAGRRAPVPSTSRRLAPRLLRCRWTDGSPARSWAPAAAQVNYMLWSYDLPLVDSYFMLDCSDANPLEGAGGAGGEGLELAVDPLPSGNVADALAGGGGGSGAGATRRRPQLEV